MINRDYFAHDTPEGVTAFQRIANAGYSAIAAGENIAARSTSGTVTNQLVLLQHQDLFVDTGVDGRGHRLNLLQANFQEIGVGQVTGNFQGFNATMLTQDFATASSRRFLTGVSYADLDHDNFYSIGEGRNGMTYRGRRLLDHHDCRGRLFALGRNGRSERHVQRRRAFGSDQPCGHTSRQHERQGRRCRSERRLHLGLAHRSRRRGDDHRAWHHRPFTDRRRRRRCDLRHQGKRHAERRRWHRHRRVLRGARGLHDFQSDRRLPDHRAGWHRPVVQHRERAVLRSDDLAGRSANSATAASALDGEHRYRDASARISDLRHR